MGMRRNVLIAFISLVLLAAACGDDVDTSTSATPTTTATTTTTTITGIDPPTAITTADDADPIVGCPSGPLFPLSAVDDVPPISQAPAGVEDAMRTFLDNEEGVFWPQDGWRILHETIDQVLAVHVGDRSTAAEAGLSFMTLEAEGDGWRWAGASSPASCPLQFQLDEGLGVVEWETDPDFPDPGPADTIVHVLANERACASGQPMGDRLNDPIVLSDASQVTITFSVVPLSGGQDCPSNPSTAVAVDLGEPLGQRRLSEGRDVGVELEDLLPPD